MRAIVSQIGQKPLNMQMAHLHHILSLNGRSGAERILVREGQEILRAVNIDPVKGFQIHVFAPNKGHTIAATKLLVYSLREAAGSRNQILKVLKIFGEEAAGR